MTATSLTHEVERFCQRLLADGCDIRMLNAALLAQAVFSMVNSEGLREQAARTLRITADHIEWGEFDLGTTSQTGDPKRPHLTVIEGGGGSKV